MKRKTLFLALLSLLVLSSVLTACSSAATSPGTGPTSSAPTSSPTSVTPAQQIDYSKLGFTDTEIKQWEEQGVASVATAEIASALAGFKVVTPGFIPSSLHPASKYMVTDHNAGLRSAGMEPKFQWIDVMLIYAREAETKPVITFIQSNHEFNTGLGKSTELCGRTVEKRYAKTETETEPGGIAYTWQNNGICYELSGTFTDDVNEAVMEKVLCSVTSE